MQHTKRILILISIVLSLLLAFSSVLLISFWISLNFLDGGFTRNTPSDEQQLRLDVEAGAVYQP